MSEPRKSQPRDSQVAQVILRAGRDRSPRQRHPWVLSGAVARVEGEVAPGALVSLRSAEGEVLGAGCYSPKSDLRVRLHAFGKEDPDPDWLARGIRAAIDRRAGHPLLEDTDAVRLVNAEADGLPGLVVDRYADVLVVRASAAGMLVRREAIAAALREATEAPVGYGRDDAAAARREGLPASEGSLWGELPAAPAPIWIREAQRAYAVDVRGGQKTGFYLDQRDARSLVQRISRGRRVLDLFCYTGGFAVAAQAGGAAAITAVDSSKEALACARTNLGGDAIDSSIELVAGDAFRHLREPGDPYDVVVLDPPPLARRRGDVERASRAYKDLLLHALRRLGPGGDVLFFACSHHISPDLFRKVAFGASRDAGRALQVMRTLEAPIDHPVALDHPEGRYLTGLWLRALT